MSLACAAFVYTVSHLTEASLLATAIAREPLGQLAPGQQTPQVERDRLSTTSRFFSPRLWPIQSPLRGVSHPSYGVRYLVSQPPGFPLWAQMLLLNVTFCTPNLSFSNVLSKFVFFNHVSPWGSNPGCFCLHFPRYLPHRWLDSGVLERKLGLPGQSSVSPSRGTADICSYVPGSQRLHLPIDSLKLPLVRPGPLPHLEGWVLLCKEITRDMAASDSMAGFSPPYSRSPGFFLCLLFLVFKTGFLCVTLAMLKLTL